MDQGRRPRGLPHPRPPSRGPRPVIEQPEVEPLGASVVELRRPASSTVLTYDDGPTPGITDRLLPVLAEAGATATFFVLPIRRVRRSSRTRSNLP